MSTAATVVLFNPGDDVMSNIQSYFSQVKTLYAVDNSTSYNQPLLERLKQLPNLVYIDNNGNHGIAHALNRGAEAAIRDGHDYLLTMDQDTKLFEGFVDRLLDRLKRFGRKDVGIIAPRYTSGHQANVGEFEEVMITMTSGNILNLRAFTQVGPFMENLFIDHVDHEYCLRLKNNDFIIVQVNDIALAHRPGNQVSVNLIFKKLIVSSHSPTRLYYFCRNGFFVSKRYRESFPDFRALFYRLLLKEICKVPFETERLRRLCMIVKGFRDYKKNRMGKIA